jgi:hypothetical protein
MQVRTSDGQMFDAWENLPENERSMPAWVGQLGHVTTGHTTIQTPDGSQLTVGPGDVLVNEHGRVHAFSARSLRRLFDVVEGEAGADQGPRSASSLAQGDPANTGRARQGMVTSDRGRLQPDNPNPGPVQNDSGAAATASGDSGAAASEQDGERTGESGGEADPAAATAAGGPGGDGGEDPAFGAVGSDGDGESAAEGEDGAGAESGGTEGGAVSPSPRRRGRK